MTGSPYFLGRNSKRSRFFADIEEDLRDIFVLIAGGDIVVDAKLMRVRLFYVA